MGHYRHMIRSLVAVVLGVGLACSLSSCRDVQKVATLTPKAVPKAPTEWDARAAKMPAPLIDTGRFLLTHGFGDPRNGAYRHFKILVDNGPERPILQAETSGWMLLPDGDGRRTAVCLDGVTYPVVGAETPADLAADVDRALAFGDRNPAPAYANFKSDAALLLLAIDGRHDLSERLISRLKLSSDPHDFVRVASKFLSRWWDQTLNAYLRGDISAAFHQAVRMKQFWPDYEKQARLILGSSWIQQMSHPALGGGGSFQAFPFLSQVGAVVDECARRIERGPVPALDLSALNRISISERIAKLIDRFDEIQSAGLIVPPAAAQPSWMGDPVFQAIVMQDRAALPALLNAMENDSRLTRAVDIGPSGATGRVVVSVKDAARRAIGAILKWTNINDINGKPVSAEQIRQFLVKNGTGTKADDWFNILADDQVTPEQWLDAATRLMQPEIGSPPDQASNAQGPIAPRLVAEAVRPRMNPSLSDLIKRRCSELLADGAQDPQIEPSNVSLAIQLALLLAKWDKASALPVIARASDLAMTTHTEAWSQAEGFLPEALRVRIALGDRTVLYQYSQWLSSLPSAQLSQLDPKLLQTMVEQSGTAEMEELGDKLFLSFDSSLNVLHMPYTDGGVERFKRLVVSPLIHLGSIQRAIRQLLQNRDSLGSVTIDDSTTYSLVLSSNSRLVTEHSSRLKTDRLAPKPGESRSFRVCDLVAFTLSGLRLAPEFEPYWPDAAKDAGIKKLRAFVDLNAARLSDLIPSDRSWPRSYSNP